MSELLPCPFCGGQAFVHGSDKEAFCVVCQGCDSTLGESFDRDGVPDFSFETAGAAVDAWNTRTQPAIDLASEPVAITGAQIARAIFKCGDGHEKAQRIEFKGGTWPDNEIAMGGFNEIALAAFLDCVLAGTAEGGENEKPNT